MKSSSMSAENYLSVNRASWNRRTDVHWTSEFYDVQGFLEGTSSLKEIERDLLGDVNGKDLLHLQCHFGQDTLSLARLGATVTGADLSDRAIERARELATMANLPARFICTDVYDLRQHDQQLYDIVFTSYGTIGWLPDLHRWAAVIAASLKPGGRFVIAEFHPVVWMYDDDFSTVAYSYFNTGAILETETGTYADRNAPISGEYVMWNHSLAEVVNSLLANGIRIDVLNEYNYSPWNCFRHTVELEPGRFTIRHLDQKIPMVFGIAGTKL